MYLKGLGGLALPSRLFANFLALLLLPHLLSAETVKSEKSYIATKASGHFATHGANLPTREFTDALHAASVDISHHCCRRSLAFLAMANEEALRDTVPVFLASLARVKLEGGSQAGQRLDSKLVLVVWSDAALALCQQLQRRYSHQCVQDRDHDTQGGVLGYRSDDFMTLGFPKVKYILNALSTGRDVVFMDTDVVVLRDPLPYIMTRGSCMLAMMEKCVLYNDTVALLSKEWRRTGVNLPALNIGVLYFKATAAVVRCVYNWLYDMRGAAEERAAFWDQDAFLATMRTCGMVHKLAFKGLDPRVFQSGCFNGCGCAFRTGDVRDDTMAHGGPYWRLGPNATCGPQHWGPVDARGAHHTRPHHVPNTQDLGTNTTTSGGSVAASNGGPAGSGSGRSTGANGGSGNATAQDVPVWDLLGPFSGWVRDPASADGEAPTPPGGWVLRHFACSGDTRDKAKLMHNLLGGVVGNTPAAIKLFGLEARPPVGASGGGGGGGGGNHTGGGSGAGRDLGDGGVRSRWDGGNGARGTGRDLEGRRHRHRRRDRGRQR